MKVISDEQLVALTVWMEAGGESQTGRVAVAEVILNRLKTGRWGKTIQSVCLFPYQFSCWNGANKNKINAFLLDNSNPVYQDCVLAYKTALNGSGYTNGATFYFNPQLALPAWATKDKYLVTIQNHVFYSG